ncbi:exopolysaccharide biosynthesis polyprenyl glycosylphosphotransferase [Halobacteriales archaeon QS_4_69_34]|nr:MAG: exopolysaccharide biosynthesis polyprenyl glycosylphosphotransferase [Halobacteriales archaeon QS_4_69_34]
MVPDRRYRIVSPLGAAALTGIAVGLANHPLAQRWFTTTIPVFDRLSPIVLAGTALEIALLTTLVTVLALLTPLFKPRPRRILDVVALTQRRVLTAALALAAVGYFDYDYRLPRATLVLTVGILLFALPAWFVAIRRPPGESERAVVIGDDLAEIEAVLEATDLPVVGYVAPPGLRSQGLASGSSSGSGSSASGSHSRNRGYADGGVPATAPLGGLAFLGGFSRIDEVLAERGVDTALLAFARPDRAEFFGALGTCYERGVAAMVRREHADSVLVADDPGGGALVAVDLEPWDWQDHAVKRAFDVAFAAVGLVLLAPIMLVIAVAIALDSPGPVLYTQERTAELGETFQVLKFRSMVADAEVGTGVVLSEEDAGGVDPRVTRIGRVLRRTHLDEIPQLWSVLVGDMSVVGPRPERPELDSDIGAGVVEWRQRWFVKPGLTGLAQINGATGHEPAEKLRYDVLYIREQSFWFDLRIVVRQVWMVLADAATLLASAGDVRR